MLRCFILLVEELIVTNWTLLLYESFYWIVV